MNDHPAEAASQEISSKPAPRSFEQELLGIAVDANELVSRIHAGQHGDLNAIIQNAIDERPVAIPMASEMPVEMKDAA